MTNFLTTLHEKTAGPLLMGILNVTEDSFSDGGDFLNAELAITHAKQMVADGAKIIDIGAESTRPGAMPVSEEVQIQRVEPLIKAIRKAVGDSVYLSIDARRTSVAEAALEAGADIINDVEAGRDDGMLELAAANSVPIVLMHMQGKPQTMQEQPRYDDVLEEVKRFLMERATAAQEAGVEKEQIIIDPGIGFG
ncbi:MAG: dihydropteroate synthase, partial [Pseudomonadota bacterium]